MRKETRLPFQIHRALLSLLILPLPCLVALALVSTLLLGDGFLFHVPLAHAGTGSGPLGSTSDAAFDDELIRRAVGNLFQLVEGAFGALLMVGAGLVALVYAAMGSYRNAISMLIVAVAAFILRSLVSLFFGADFPSFSM